MKDRSPIAAATRFRSITIFIVLSLVLAANCGIAQTGKSDYEPAARDPGSISCGVSAPKTHAKGSVVQSVLSDTSCRVRRAIGNGYNNSGDYASAYKALKSYAQHCYDSLQSWRVFGDIQVAIQNLSTDGARYDSHRDPLC